MGLLVVVVVVCMDSSPLFQVAVGFILYELFVIVFVFSVHFCGVVVVVLWVVSLRWWKFSVLLLFLLFCLQEVEDGDGLFMI